MARKALRLSGPAALTTSAATQYTVPSTTKTEVRYIHAQSPVAATLTMSIGTDAAGKRIHDATPLAANVPLNDFCFHVLEAAEVVQAFASTTSVVLTVDGVEITLG